MKTCLRSTPKNISELKDNNTQTCQKTQRTGNLSFGVSGTVSYLSKKFVNGGKVKKGEVLTKVWGIQNSYKTHSLETHIYRLRKKIANEFGNDLTILSKIGQYTLKYK